MKRVTPMAADLYEDQQTLPANDPGKEVQVESSNVARSQGVDYEEKRRWLRLELFLSFIEWARGKLGRQALPSIVEPDGEGGRDVGLPRTQTVEGWEDCLRLVVEELRALGGSTEGQFLAIGSKFQDFYRDAREISRMSSSVSSLMSGEEISTTINGLQKILNGMKGLDGETRRSAETLSGILDILGNIHNSLAGFQKVVQVLNVLCISTRIESARFGENDTGFDTLADDIKKLALHIEAKFANILNQSETLSLLIRDALSRVVGLEARQRGQAQAILDRLMEGLGSLMEKHELSSRAARNVSARYQEISGGIGEIVASMQFHDITRQQIGHVEQALEDLAPVAAGVVERDGRKGWSRRLKKRDEHRRAIEAGAQQASELESPLEADIGKVGDVCELQSIQLVHARDKLSGAVNRIIHNLRATASHIQGMSKEIQEMAGAAGEAGDSFLSGMESGLSVVTAALAEYTGVNAELSAAIRSVTSTIVNMSAFVSDIERISLQIKLIALNAIVKAEHIGETGVALGVLADAVHRLSVETRDQTASVSEVFRAINAAAEELSLNVDVEKQGGGLETGHMAEELKALIATLHDVNQRIVGLLTRIDESGRKLWEDIEQTVSEVTVHEHVTGVIDRVVLGLDAVVDHSRFLVPSSSTLERADMLKALESAYTMHSEREVHELVLGGAPSDSAGGTVTGERAKDAVSGSCGSESDAEASEEDLGDNFELF